MWDWVMQRRRQVIVLVSLAMAVLVLAPLVWWQYFGPNRFDGDLELGVAPEDLPAAAEQPPADDLDQEFSFLDAADQEAAEAAADIPEPVPLPPLQLSDTTRVTLIFSVGSDGMTREEARRLRVNDLGDRGSDKLTDSIMLLVSDTETREAALFSLPRDLYLSHRGRRINATFASRGIQAFVDDVTRVSGLPVHHVVQMNFTAFATLVEAVGGVALNVPQPMADLHSSLYIPDAGCWLLDGADALAYARSRQPLTTTDGGEHWRMAAGANDFSRISRQQGLAAAAWDQVRGPGFVRRLPDLVRLANGLTIDRGLGIGEVVDLARAFSDVAAGRVEGHILPTQPRRIAGAAVLVIDWQRALPLYERLRSWPPSAGAATSSDEPAAGPTQEPSEPASSEPAPSETGPSETGPSETGSQADEPAADDADAADPSEADEAPAQRRAARQSGCSRAVARELPDDPQRYLAAIAAGDPPPAWDPAPPSGDGAEPTDEPSDASDAPAESEPSEAEPDDGSVPSDEPSSGPSDDDPEDDGVPTDLPTGDPDGGGTQDPTTGP